MNKAIVTGASSGIGKAICRQLAANGWLVYGIGRSFNQSDDIAGIERIVCDITDTAKLIKTIKEINKNHDISLLINNAGVGFYALHEELNPVKISQMVRTNLEAPMIITNLLLRDLKKNKGTIINISSRRIRTAVPMVPQRQGLRAFPTACLRRRESTVCVW